MFKTFIFFIFVNSLLGGLVLSFVNIENNIVKYKISPDFSKYSVLREGNFQHFFVPNMQLYPRYPFVFCGGGGGRVNSSSPKFGLRLYIFIDLTYTFS